MYTSSKRKRVNPQAAMRFTRLRFELVLSNCRPSKTLNGVARHGPLPSLRGRNQSLTGNAV